MAYGDEEVFAQIIAQRTGFDPSKETWVKSLYNVAKKYIDSNMVDPGDKDTLYELILTDTSSPELEPFRQRFSVFLDDINAAKAGAVRKFDDISQYVGLEREYSKVLNSKPGFSSIATVDNIKKFMTGKNSVQEISDRIDNAYFAINTADQALKDQIKEQFPSITEEDLARSLVTGDLDSVQQKIKFGAAGIAASAKLAGIKAESNLEDLAKQGVTRESALKGFQQVAREQTGIQQAARTFGAKAPTQMELEAEALTGAESKTARQLRSQARAQFGGQTGIVTGSLGRKKQV